MEEFRTICRCEDIATYFGRLQLWGKKVWHSPVVLALTLAILLVAPINMSNNSRLPLIGSMENAGRDYSSDNLKKATAAYASVRIMDKTISVIQSAEISPPFVSFRPGEVLAAANDSLERLADALFWIMGISLAGTVLSALLTFLCFKVCLPLGITLLLVDRYTQLAWPKPFARMFLKLGMIAWLFFPLMSMTGNYIKDSFLNEQENKIQAFIAEDTAHLSTIASVLTDGEVSHADKAMAQVRSFNNDVEAPKQDAEEGWLHRMKDTVSSKLDAGIQAMGGFVARLSHMVNDVSGRVERLIEETLKLVILFLLTSVLIPLGALGILIFAMNSIRNDCVTGKDLIK